MSAVDRGYAIIVWFVAADIKAAAQVLLEHVMHNTWHRITACDWRCCSSSDFRSVENLGPASKSPSPPLFQRAS